MPSVSKPWTMLCALCKSYYKLTSETQPFALCPKCVALHSKCAYCGWEASDFMRPNKCDMNNYRDHKDELMEVKA